MDADVVDLAQAACIELFADYGVDLTPLVSLDRPSSGTTCGIIGFVGQGIRGCAVLVASGEVQRRSYPVERAEPGWDWPGELANQLVGRLKRRLLARGAEISLSTPVVLRGFELTPVMARSGLRFEAAPGWVELWLDVTLGPEFALHEPDASAPACFAEGEGVLF